MGSNSGKRVTDFLASNHFIIMRKPLTLIFFSLCLHPSLIPTGYSSLFLCFFSSLHYLNLRDSSLWTLGPSCSNRRYFMVHIQVIKSVWSTLHKVLLQTVGSKRKATEGGVLCLEEEGGKGKWSILKDTRRSFFLFSVNFPERFLCSHHTLLPSSSYSSPDCPLLLRHFYSVPVPQVLKIQRWSNAILTSSLWDANMTQN